MPTSVRSRQIINFLRVITTLSRSAWLLADCLKDPVNRTTWVGWGDDEETNSSLLEGGARPGKFPGPTSDRKMVCGQLWSLYPVGVAAITIQAMSGETRPGIYLKTNYSALSIKRTPNWGFINFMKELAKRGRTAFNRKLSE